MIKMIIVLMLIGNTLAFSNNQNRNFDNKKVEFKTNLNKTIELEKLLEYCSDWQSGQYRIDPYLKTAIFLQKMGKERAIELLLKMTETKKYEYQIIYLCRMLFEENGTNKFRAPALGTSGHTEEWTRDPIEIINGIPFLITSSYAIGGSPEPASKYLNYCKENCKWSEIIYKVATKEEKELALKILIGSDNWKNKELSESSVKLFRDQI